MAKRVSVPILVRLRTQSECRRPPKLLFNCITFIFKSAVRGAGGNRLNVRVKMKISIRYSILSSCLNEGRKKREWPVGLFTRIAEPEPPLPLHYLCITSTIPSMSKRTKLIQYLIKLYRTVHKHKGGSDTCSVCTRRIAELCEASVAERVPGNKDKFATANADSRKPSSSSLS